MTNSLHGLTRLEPAWIAKTIAAAVLIVVIIAPLLASWGRPESGSLYSAFSTLCHQLPERSWRLAGLPLAVCVRCFGFYFGVCAAIWLGLAFDRRTVVFSGAAMFLTWALEACSLVFVPSGVRFLTGLAFGAATASVLPRRRARLIPAGTHFQRHA